MVEETNREGQGSQQAETLPAAGGAQADKRAVPHSRIPLVSTGMYKVQSSEIPGGSTSTTGGLSPAEVVPFVKQARSTDSAGGGNNSGTGGVK